MNYKKDPYFPTGLPSSYKGVSIYQEAILRFMSQNIAHFGYNYELCAKEAKEFANAYIKTISDD